MITSPGKKIAAIVLIATLGAGSAHARDNAVGTLTECERNAISICAQMSEGLSPEEYRRCIDSRQALCRVLDSLGNGEVQTMQPAQPNRPQTGARPRAAAVRVNR